MTTKATETDTTVSPALFELERPSTHAGDLDSRDAASGGAGGVTFRRTSQILTKCTGFLSAYDFALNPYSGCAFGCSYCYAAFFARDVEKRDSWGQWVQAKENAVEILQRPRQRAKLDGARIYMSSVTDPYQPIERKERLTRGLLEIMADGHTPKLVVQTRSPDVVRDVDLFRQIEANGGRVQVNMTVTTDDDAVRKAFEPSCPSNQRRIDAIRQVHDSGVQSCITLTPLLWCDDAGTFADCLRETGIEQFIVQPFHFGKGGSRFVANTRGDALDLMAQKLDCPVDAVEREYLKRYEQARAILANALPNLGEGKSGFAPPF